MITSKSWLEILTFVLAHATNSAPRGPLSCRAPTLIKLTWLWPSWSWVWNMSSSNLLCVVSLCCVVSIVLAVWSVWSQSVPYCHVCCSRTLYSPDHFQRLSLPAFLSLPSWWFHLPGPPLLTSVLADIWLYWPLSVSSPWYSLTVYILYTCELHCCRFGVCY